jgi:hypothetical protein
MPSEEKVRITFACNTELRDKLTNQADTEGITRTQLIVELLESSVSGKTIGGEREPAVQRLLYDLQRRLGDMEKWRREIKSWVDSADEDRLNLEGTLADFLTEQVKETGIDTKMKVSDKKKIPAPKK